MVEPKKRSDKWSAPVYDYTDDKGKRHYKRITAATKAEWYIAYGEFEKERALSNEERKEKASLGLTVGEAVDLYIEHQRLLCSPTTIAGYEKDRKTRFQSLMDCYVKKLSYETVQAAITDECRTVTRRGTVISAKSVINAYSLIATALYAECGVRFRVKLPKKTERIIDLPSVSEIAPLVQGTEIELPCMLAMWLSFSLSEVRGLMCSSVRNGKIFIDQVKVIVDGIDVVKSSAKNNTRLRAHSIPPYIMALIEKQETWQHYKETGEDDFLISLNANQIRGRFEGLMDRNGYPDMSFHKLRHMSASVMALLGVPDKYAMERGGWKTDHVMKKVYQHTFYAERQAVDARIDEFMVNILEDSLRGTSGEQKNDKN